MNKELFWGVSLKQMLFILFFYFFIGSFYYVTVTIAEFEEFNRMPQLIMFYVLIALLTVPLWWFYFVLQRDVILNKKIFWHILTCPGFVFLLIIFYHLLCDTLKIARLRERQAMWDINYATLIYGLQFGIFHFYEYYLRFREKQQKESELRQLKMQNEIQLLKSQLEPHFLFNTLNSISASVPKEQEKTRILISKLADTFRYALDSSREEYISLDKELSFIKTYLSLEKERFGENLSVKYNVEDEVLNAKVPVMLLQPLVENAIKHGISVNPEGGLITIDIEMSGDLIFFKIGNSGLPVSIEQMYCSKGIGLSNTILRLQKLYNQHMSIVPYESGGLVLYFKIPYKRML
jgi:two-component system, LytTR family, sensor kinase